MKKLSAAHCEGPILLVKNKHQQHNSKIYSCGNGEDASSAVAIWNLKDHDYFDQKTIINLKEKWTGAFACYGNDLFVGVKNKNKQNVTQYALFRYTIGSNNSVESELQVVNFSEKILSVDVSSNGIYVVCLRINSTDTKYTHAKTHELEGAVVWISVDPTSTNFAVSSSDGMVSVFPVEDIDSQLDMLDTANYQILSSFKPEDGQVRLRTCWSPSGEELYIPAEGHVKIISTENWNEKYSIYYNKEPLSLFGSVIYCCNSLFAFNNKEKLACFDLITMKTTYENDIEIEPLKKDIKSPYISSIAFVEDGKLAIGAKTGDIQMHQYEVLPADAVMLDEDETSVAKIKSQYGLNEPDQPPSVLIEKVQVREVLVPGQAKESNDFSCLKWNAFGYVFDRVIDGERSIEVKFHDASLHEVIGMDNQTTRYVFADLNNSLLALASQKNDKKESELYVRQVSSWDRDNCVWSVTMPSEETIEAITVGQNFVVSYSDLRFVRVYSATGLLRFIFSATGPLRSIVASGNSLCLVRDSGGLIIEHPEANFERRYIVDLYKVSPLSSNVLTIWQKGVSLPLSPESDLSWVSFTPAGNLCTMDDLFVVRYLAPNDFWVPVFMGADVLKNANDHAIWPISLSERPVTKFRYIYCRGRSKPNFEKTELPITVEWSVPVENKESEKGKFEHELILNDLMQTISRAPQSGFSTLDQQILAKEHSKAIMLLFGLCCKKARDSRALEVANMTSQQNLALLQSFSAKSKRNLLTSKIEALFSERSSQNTSSSLPVNIPTPALKNVQQVERRVQLQQKRTLGNVTSKLIGPASLNISSSAPLNESLITPVRLETPLPDISNTQDSLISLPATPSMDRKRNFDSLEINKEQKATNQQ
ncbi:Mcl1-mid domain-containing protein [Aphelenchoides bicaudatus]|nr:Mcl1-mid domain-containing protein [Aphelenchoides bicaudatus]